MKGQARAEMGISGCTRSAKKCIQRNWLLAMLTMEQLLGKSADLM